MNKLTSMSGGFAGYSSLSFSKLKVTGGISQASGGTITQYLGYNIHTFDTSGIFEVLSDQLTVQVLVVGGGGGAFATSGGFGGGGAGGVIHRSSMTFAKGQYTTTVGSGAPYVLFNVNQKTGYNSSVYYNGSPLLIAYGGASGLNLSSVAVAGGSGAGGTYSDTNTAARNGSLATQSTSTYGGFGYPGGNASLIGGVKYGGAGGGAGGAGGINGGIGIINPIVGSTIGELVSGQYWIAGGGGSSGDTGSTFGGNGGKGGGGAGSSSASSSTSDSKEGLANTGGGAGAGLNRPSISPTWNVGGSGVVIFKYLST